MKKQSLLLLVFFLSSVVCKSQIYCQVQPRIVSYQGWPALLFDETAYPCCYNDLINLSGYTNPNDPNTALMDQVLDVTLFTQQSFGDIPTAESCITGTYYCLDRKNLNQIFCDAFSSYRTNQVWYIVFHYTTNVPCLYSITQTVPYENLLIICRTIYPVPVAGSLYFGYQGIENDTIQWGTDPGNIGNTLPNGGDGIFTYQWVYFSAASDSLPVEDASSQDFDPGELSFSGKYLRVDIPDACGLPISTNKVNIEVLPNVQPGAISSAPHICYGDTALITSLAPGSGGTGIYQYGWQMSTDGANFSIIAGQYNQNLVLPDIKADTWIQRTCTSGVNDAVSTTLYLKVDPPVPIPAVSTDSQYCYGANVLLKDSGTATANETVYWYGINSLPDSGNQIRIPAIQGSMNLFALRRTKNGCVSDTAWIRLSVLKVVAAFKASLDTIQSGEQVQFINESINGTSFVWYFSEGDSSCVFSPWHYFNIPGEKDICLIASQGTCSDTALMEKLIDVLELTSVPAEIQNVFEVFPNPFNAKLHIRRDPIENKSFEVELYDVYGSLHGSIQCVAECSMEVQNLPSGLYLVKINDGKQQYIFKVLKIQNLIL